MKRQFTLAAMACLTLAANAVAQHQNADSSGTEPPTVQQPGSPSENAPWGLVFAPIPEILRLHCPPLRGNHGLLVREVAADSPAAQIGVREGDILLQSEGVPLAGPDQLPSPEQTPGFTVLRRGQIRFLRDAGTRRPSTRWPFAGRNWMTAPPVISSRGSTSTASSTSIANGSGSVSMSRAGDQISLEMSMPDVSPSPIRLRGTRDEIEQQLRDSSLSPEGRQRVRSVLDRAP